MKTNEKTNEDGFDQTLTGRAKITTNDSKSEAKTTSKMRQIVIETDGNNIHLVKADVVGKIELVAILQSIIGFLNKK